MMNLSPALLPNHITLKILKDYDMEKTVRQEILDLSVETIVA
jgi:hypothetical protein